MNGNDIISLYKKVYTKIVAFQIFTKGQWCD